MEERENGITTQSAFYLIKKRIVWILLAAVLVTVVAALVTAFALNGKKDVYSVSFALEYPNSETGLYPDGSTFRYETIVFSDNLKKTKEADEKFSSIDVEGMTEAGAISISERVRETADSETASLGIYTIEVKSSYFRDRAQASDFLHALCDNVVEDICGTVEENNYAVALSTYENLGTYGERINALQAQKNYLQSVYDRYVTRYGEFSLEGKTMTVYAGELSTVFSGEVRLSTLIEDLDNNKYLLPSQTGDQVRVTIAALEREATRNEASISALERQLRGLIELYGSSLSQSQLDTFESFHNRISELTVRNAQIEMEVTELHTALGDVKNAETGVWEPTGERIDDTEFAKNLQTLYNAIDKETTNCKKVISALFREQTRFSFEQTGVIVTKDDANLIFVCIVAFVLSFLIASVAVCLIEHPAYAKKRAAEAAEAKPEETKPAEKE